MSLLDLVKAKESAEEKLGFEIDSETAASVLAHAARKCVLLNKGTDYLGILYENELRDHYMRMAINLKGAMANV